MRCFIFLMTVLLLNVSAYGEGHLIVIGANDTHSAIDPDMDDNTGGFLRRRAYIDSVRAHNKNVLVLHAGDAVQGTIYFNYFNGAVEYAAIDSLRYDAITLGNHEFDDGIDSLYRHYSRVKTPKLSANYDFSATPLAGMLRPYIIKTFEGKRIGIFGLNPSPYGLIDANKFGEVRYLDADSVAQATASYLKNVQKVDFVIMLSHVGQYTRLPGTSNDSIIASKSRYIDLIVGGHTHTVIQPNSIKASVKNADNRDVTVTQAGQYGPYLSRCDINLENFEVDYQLIPINESLDPLADNRRYDAFRQWLAPYKNVVDSINSRYVVTSSIEMPKGSIAEQNWLCDVVLEVVQSISPFKDVDAVVLNKGGMRRKICKGVVTEGRLRAAFPFKNNLTVIELSGADLLATVRTMASCGDCSVSGTVRVELNDKNEVVDVKIKDKSIDPEATYLLATTDFLAAGGDGLNSLKNGRIVYDDKIDGVPVPYVERIIDYLAEIDKKGVVLTTSTQARFFKK